jgi:recombination protein RecT
MNNRALSQAQNQSVDVKSLLKSDDVKRRFGEILKEKAPAFMTSLLSTVESSPQLKAIGQTGGMSIIRAAAIAASLDLPVEKSLGFAWIVPYGNEAQFQLGWRGFVQLALRSGQYSRMTLVPVYQGQLVQWDALREVLNLDLAIVSGGDPIGWAVYFRLLNGFEKTAYYSREELLSHGKRYSKSFASGPWKTHADEMCAKTAIKRTLSKWGILSVDMRTAIVVDQSVGTEIPADMSNETLRYPDAPDAVDAVDASDVSGYGEGEPSV